MDKSLLNNERGVVLVMVLLILVATILLGIAVSRSAFFESKIAGNERIYQSDFYATEAAGDYLIANFDAIMSKQAGVTLNTTVDMSSHLADLATANQVFSDMTLTITMTKKGGTPPAGSGMGVGTVACDYYTMHQYKGSQHIEVGLWKAFPTQK